METGQIVLPEDRTICHFSFQSLNLNTAPDTPAESPQSPSTPPPTTSHQWNQCCYAAAPCW